MNPNHAPANDPAQNPAQPFIWPRPTLDRNGRAIDSDVLCLFEDIQAEEYPRTALFVVPSEEMAPQLRTGYTVLSVHIYPDDYDTLTGVVEVKLAHEPKRSLLGRVKRWTADQLFITQDQPNPDVELTIERNHIVVLSSVRYIIHGKLA